MSLRKEIPIVVLDASGNAVTNGSVYINVRGGGSATVFTSETDATVNTQPIATDSSGRIEGWLGRGQYEAQITAPGFPARVEPFDIVPAGDGTVDTNFIADSAITAVKLASNAVTTAKVSDGAITAEKRSQRVFSFAGVNSYTISGLNGDTAIGYKCRIVALWDGISSESYPYINMNGATSSSRTWFGRVFSATDGTLAGTSGEGPIRVNFGPSFGRTYDLASARNLLVSDLNIHAAQNAITQRLVMGKFITRRAAGNWYTLGGEIIGVSEFSGNLTSMQFNFDNGNVTGHITLEAWSGVT